MRQGKDHMEIRGIDNFSAAAVHPDLFIDSLAVGTITIPAGIIVDLRMSAFGADADIAAAFFGSASDDCMSCSPLCFGLVVFFTEPAIRRTEDILYHEVRHGYHLPAGQKG